MTKKLSTLVAALARPPQSIWADPLPLPEVPLIDRPGRPRATAPLPELKPLPRRTVMVVDDEPQVLETMVRILGKENYELVVAASPAEALAESLARDGRIDLLVTDFEMPGMRGRELADKIRAHVGDLPVLYQTGFADMLFRDRNELEAGSAFLEKPFTARGLREAARFLLFGSINPPALPDSTNPLDGAMRS
ncbi:MAG TPA: response regulator [Vicinamibacterales bacterium]|nr:response regulator [Vicinamibacterales bacterium]